MSLKIKNNRILERSDLDSRQLLKRELERRCLSNTSYSLRSFAKALGISHTVLSLVLAGKRTPSKNMILKISNALDLTTFQKQKLLERKILNSIPELSKPETDYYQMDLDKFEIISEWHYYAILSLLDIESYSFNAKNIAQSIGVSVFVAQEAIERLKRIGIISQNSHGKWMQSTTPIRIKNNTSTEYTKKFHSQLLSKANQSLQNDSFNERELASITFSCSPDCVPYARERIRKFKRELSEELEKMGPKERVYNLSIQFFPLSTNHNKKENK